MNDDIMKMWMDSWSEVTRNMVSSDAFAAASTATLDWSLHCQKQMRDASGQWMEAMEFPKRSDMARLSKQILACEARIGDCEDKLDELSAKLDKVLSLLKTAGRAPARSAKKS